MARFMLGQALMQVNHPIEAIQQFEKVIEHYSNLFKSADEITQEIEAIKDILFSFNIENAEEFSRQISQMQDRSAVLALKKALADARNLYNLIRLQGDYTLLQQLDFQKLNQLYRETCNHLDLLNLKESIESATDTSNLLNVALEDVLFKFVKIKEEELVLADKLKNTLRQTREALAENFDLPVYPHIPGVFLHIHLRSGVGVRFSPFPL